MEDVTRGYAGYRLEPHPFRFGAPIQIRLAFAPEALPAGTTPGEVWTFYFDEAYGRWTPLEKVGTDRARNEIVSLTDHFTDVINAVIVVPEHPQAASFTPDLLKEIRSADPGAQINLLQPPGVNHFGDARLSYPIEVPPGRAGLQPSLAAQYSSATGTGWMGVGWDLPVQAVTVDTRWGVPRYDAGLETETYHLEGEELTPVAHRAALQVRAAEKVFHTRIEGQFRQVLRHGDRPESYWWEVVDKNGMRSFYGGDPVSGPSAAATLVDGRGDIFLWALRETRDTNGNFVRYRYARVEDPGVAGGAVLGSNLYPREITYTGSGGTEGPYAVTFVRDRELGESRRPDVTIDARGGFKRVTADLLRQIDIRVTGELVRRYEFRYVEGAFRKTLLHEIIQSGADGTEFNRHTFEYYDEVRDEFGAYQGFDAATTHWNLGDDGVSADLLGLGDASALGGTIGTGLGGHLYVGFNPLYGSKFGSFGFKVGHQEYTSEAALALVDINGDSLPDKVFKAGDGFAFRANRSGPNGIPVFGPLQPIPTLPAIEEERTQTTSLGGEVYVVVNAFVNEANTFTTSRAYLTDVNGDGLADLVLDGRVLFNHLVGGIPTFSPDSTLTPVPIGPGAVDATDLIADYEAIYQSNIDAYPLVDTLRTWFAPFDGRILIGGAVALIDDPSPQRDAYTTADGVRVAIQQNGSELWSATIGPDDFAPRTPTGVDSILVRKGDRLYFRVQSVFDGKFDQVQWDPEIAYLDIAATTDVNNLDPYRYRAAGDFVLAGRTGITVQMPFNGTVRLEGDVQKLGVTTDDVTIVVSKNGATMFSQFVPWDAAGAVPMSVDIPVLRDDLIGLRLNIPSNVDLRQLQWDPRLFYVESPDVPVQDETGAYIIQLSAPFDMDFYPVNDLTSPQAAWTVPTTGTVRVKTDVTTAGGDTTTDGELAFTVKRRGALVAKDFVEIIDGTVSNVELSLDVREGEEYFFDFAAYDPNLRSNLAGTAALVAYSPYDPLDFFTVPSALHSTSLPGLFPQPYRGWAYAGYNGNRTRALLPIDESALFAFDMNDPANYDPTTARAFLFNPLPAESSWRGPDDLTWVRSGSMSSSRFGLDFVDVPRPGSFAGARAVSRLGRTEQTAVGGGVSYFSGSLSGGRSRGEVDFLDMNGDRFPDVLGNGRIQFTTMTGGLEPSNRALPGFLIRLSENTAFNVGVGGSPAAFLGNARGRVDTTGTSVPKSNETGAQMEPLGLSFNLGGGDSHIPYDLMDINGDGLPDRVSTSSAGLMVALNLGYSFAPEELWGAPAAINAGTSTSLALGASLGFNGGIYDFAGGISLSENDSTTGETLLDIDGDGLVDQVRPQGGSLQVKLNTGSGFAPAIDWRGALGDQGIAKSDVVGLGGGVYFTIAIGPLCWPTPFCWIIINPGVDGARSMSRQTVSVRDVDGDGHPDHVFSDSDGAMEVARNRTGRTNLLRTVHRPLGGSFVLDYARDGNTYDNPQSRWVLARATLFDGLPGDGVDAAVTTYRYGGGRFDRLEREFLGYGTVFEEIRDPARGDAVYRTVAHEFLNDSYYTRGLVRRELTRDAFGQPLREAEYTYALRDVETGVEPAPGDSTTATLFAKLVRIDSRFFEGLSAPGKFTFVTYDYDDFGNVVRFFDAADLGAQDDVDVRIRYSAEDPACAAARIVGKPTRIEVFGNGIPMRKREATLDCTTGNTTQVRQYLATGDAAVTDLTYHPNGNLESVVGPPNATGQRFAVTFEYDPVVNTHITVISDSYGYHSSSTFNYKYGKPETVVDINGNITTYAYDAVGRTLSVTGPYDQGGGPTITFEYHPEAPVPYAVTRHLDEDADGLPKPSGTLDTILFVDGLGRAVQTKRDATIHVGPDAPPMDVMTVSGRITFDHVGRPVETYHPTTEPKGTNTIFNASYDPVTPTRMSYDALDRTTEVVLPDGTRTSYAYGFGTDREGMTQFETTITDANGHVRKTFKDVRETITSVQEFNRGSAIWTSYTYDPLRQITGVRDDLGNVTAVEYDNLGRRTVLDSPDSGRTEFRFDLASNVVAKITANLRAEAEQISYAYDFTRLASIAYPNFPGNNVTYEYGAPGAPDNRAGRIVRVVDESGSAERSYGRLGEIVMETRTVITDQTPHEPEVYTTRYSYDSFGRFQRMTYPDGEVLTYRYDSGGQVAAARGVKAGLDYSYVDRVEYDKFAQRAYLEYANGVRTSYTYNPLNLRPVRIQASRADGTQFQNLLFSYDNVGNVVEIRNDVSLPASNEFGGPTVQEFTYDDLNRLTHAAGVYQFAPSKTNRYTLAISYDSINRVTSKEQVHEIGSSSGGTNVQKKTSYSWTYEYGGPHPHAPTHIGDLTFAYDANGNQLGWTNDKDGTRRTIIWDEENRIQNVFDGGQEQSYRYDDQGVRVVKRTANGETAYVNQYFTIRNSDVGTKHVFVDNARAVSKLVKQNLSGSPPVEKDLYFFHPDQVGSSSYITAPDGTLYEHLEYFPFGETWVDESSTTVRTPYRFTGKELDETGLYYFGARYYDPRITAWTAPDPDLGKYLDSDVSGGIFTPVNLGVYGYAALNPVRYSDPNGRGTWDRISGALKLIGGVTEAIAGGTLAVTTGVTGVGAVAGTVVAVHGIDVAASGLRQLISGKPESSLTSQGLQALGVSHNAAEWIDTGISVVGSAGATLAAKALTRGAAAVAAAAPAAERAGLSVFERAAEFGIKPYRELLKLKAGTGLEAHHLIEQRFARLLGQNPREMLSIALTEAEHSAFTREWRRLIPYGEGTINATKEEVVNAARHIYRNYPAILEALGLK